MKRLRLRSGPNAIEVCPERGALVTSWVHHGDERLFLDEATFADPTKNVRGGIPLLFPIAGPAASASPMKQHGFARNAAFTVASATEDAIVLSLTASHATRELFAYDFELRFEVTVPKLTWSIRNTGTAPMPLQFGLHPYFQVPLQEKHAARIELEPTRAFNNRTKAFEPSAGSPRFDGDEVDLHFIAPASRKTTLHRGARPPIHLEWSNTFHTLVTWSLPHKPFICVEPWSSPALAASAAPLPLLAAGAVETFWLTAQ